MSILKSICIFLPLILFFTSDLASAGSFGRSRFIIQCKKCGGSAEVCNKGQSWIVCSGENEKLVDCLHIDRSKIKCEDTQADADDDGDDK